MQSPAAESAAVQEGDPGQQLRDKLRKKFESSVQDNRDLDDAGRDYLLEQFRDAITNAPIEPKFIAKPDRGQWVEMLESLHEDGFASDDDVAALIRQFDDAMAPLDSPDVERATEFARRCEEDGEEQALAWLEAQREAAKESEQATSTKNQDTRLQPAKPRLRRTRSPRGSPL